VAYRQPITRAEIEDIRGVSVSSHIMKTLQERDWVRIVGHKDVPGKPALYATTKGFLDYFNLKSLEELPSLMEIRDLDKISAEIDIQAAEATRAAEQPQDLIEDEDIERLMPDGEADHGEGIEDNVEENLEADIEGGSETPGELTATAASDQPLENSVSEALDESMQAEAGEELVEAELEAHSEHNQDQGNEVLTESSNDQEALSEEIISDEEMSEEELSGERVSEAQTVAGDMVEVDEQSEDSIAAMADSTEEDALELDELHEDMQETAQERTHEITDVQEMEDNGVSDSSAEDLNDAEETSPKEAEARGHEIEAETGNEQPFDAHIDKTSEDLNEPRFSTANYGLRPGQQDDTSVDDTGQDDSEIAEDEQHPERLSAAESNS
jgi:segregation and condensation protein B